MIAILDDLIEILVETNKLEEFREFCDNEITEEIFEQIARQGFKILNFQELELVALCIDKGEIAIAELHVFRRKLTNYLYNPENN